MKRFAAITLALILALICVPVTAEKADREIEGNLAVFTTAEDFAVCRPGCEALGLAVEIFPDSPAVKLPSGTHLADVLYAAGNLIAR